jgi:hypothetical protein
LKLSILNKGVIVKVNQFTVSKSNNGDSPLIIPIVTTKPCKVTFNWNGPNANFKVYQPTTSTPTTNGNPIIKN